MQSNFTVEAQDVINELLEQVKQLSLSNAMLRAKLVKFQMKNKIIGGTLKEAKFIIISKQAGGCGQGNRIPFLVCTIYLSCLFFIIP